jgi:hypothetical protein
MTPDHGVVIALILSGSILAAPIVLSFAYNLFPRKNPMAVSPEFQAQFDRISAEIADLKATQSDPAVQAALDAANAEIAQLKQDAADALAAATAIS